MSLINKQETLIHVQHYNIKFSNTVGEGPSTHSLHGEGDLSVRDQFKDPEDSVPLGEAEKICLQKEHQISGAGYPVSASEVLNEGEGHSNWINKASVANKTLLIFHRTLVNTADAA